MEAVNTTTSTSKLHQFWGMTTRASGIAALCSTNTPAQRVRHVTSRNVGESRVFFIDLGIGRVDRAQAVAYIMADETRKQFWINYAVQYGYTAEQAVNVLGAVAAKTATVPTMPTQQAAPDTTEDTTEDTTADTTADQLDQLEQLEQTEQPEESVAASRKSRRRR